MKSLLHSLIFEKKSHDIQFDSFWQLILKFGYLFWHPVKINISVIWIQDWRMRKNSMGFRNIQEKLKTVFCYQNCSDLLWEKIVLGIEKNFEIQGWIEKHAGKVRKLQTYLLSSSRKFKFFVVHEDWNTTLERIWHICEIYIEVQGVFLSRGPTIK